MGDVDIKTKMNYLGAILKKLKYLYSRMSLHISQVKMSQFVPIPPQSLKVPHLTSVYIPRIHSNWTEMDVARVVNEFGLGAVYNVDFVELGQKRGFQPVSHGPIRKAFVHFITSSINRQHSFWKNLQANQVERLYLDERQYWICLPNKRLAPRTTMNLHQIVDNALYLENKVLEQEQTIASMAQQLESMTHAFEMLSDRVNKL